MAGTIYRETTLRAGFVNGRYSYLPPSAEHERVEIDDPAIKESVERLSMLIEGFDADRLRPDDTPELSTEQLEAVIFADEPVQPIPEPVIPAVIDLRDSVDNEIKRSVFDRFRSGFRMVSYANSVLEDQLADTEFKSDDEVNLAVLETELSQVGELTRLEKGKTGLKRRKWWHRRNKHDFRIAIPSVDVQQEEVALSSIRNLADLVKSRRSEYSMSLRVGKRVSDAYNWVAKQASLSGEHATRNRVVAGLGILVVGYMVAKNLNIGGHEDTASATVGDLPGSDHINVQPKGHGTIGHATTTFEPFSLDLPSDNLEIISQPTPEIIPDVQTTQITIAPGQGMWSALSGQGFEDRQILDILHNYADQQGVSYGSLGNVEVGQTFVLELV